VSELIISHPIWASRRVHLLIDPDKWKIDELSLMLSSIPGIVGSLLVGGTYLHSGRSQFEAVMECCSRALLPLGNIITAGLSDGFISPKADYVLAPILFGSPTTRFVIDHILRAVPLIKEYDLPCIPYGYFMLAGGVPTSTEYFTQTLPIPRGNVEILSTLSLAAKYLGLPGLYLEAGSGAQQPVRPDEVEAVKRTSELRILVGGGISAPSVCRELFNAGADGIIVGTALERSKSLDWLEGIS
jgi:phosphoglycerol geranylgeranyltransferase